MTYQMLVCSFSKKEKIYTYVNDYREQPSKLDLTNCLVTQNKKICDFLKNQIKHILWKNRDQTPFNTTSICKDGIAYSKA